MICLKTYQTKYFKKKTENSRNSVHANWLFSAYSTFGLTGQLGRGTDGKANSNVIFNYKNTTFNDGYLGLLFEEERSKVR